MQLPTTNSSKVKGYAAGILAAIFYGTNPLGSLPLYADNINSATILFYRYGLAVAMFAIWMLAKGETFKIKRGHAIRFIVLGGFFALSSTFLYVSFLYMDAGVASTILFSYPIMVAVLMTAVFHEHITWTTVTSILLACVGIGLLRHGDGEVNLSTLGLMFVLLSSLLYAIYIIAVRQWKSPYDSVKFTFWICAGGLLTILGFSVFAHEPIVLLHTAKQWACAVQLALLPTVLSLFFMTVAIKNVGATPSAIMGALEPVTAVVISVLLFGEAFTIRLAIGIVLILSGVILIVLRKKQ